MNRRKWLLETFAGTFAVLPLRAQTSRAKYAYVGCYTTQQRYGHGDGIHVYRVEPGNGAWSPIQQVGNLINPSFLITSRDGRFLYSVHGDEDYATAFAIDSANGTLRLINKAATGGRNGVHQAFDPTGGFMLVANYASGTLAVMPVRKDGGLDDQIQLVKLEGEPGPHKVEQTGSHPHNVVFDPSGRFVIVPDKGLDRVFVFRFENGRLAPSSSVAARPGWAPRHVAFHPRIPVAWVLNELSSTVTTYRFDGERGALTPVQNLPSLPEDFTGNSTGAEIAISKGGGFVYCSNRGHDSIAVFRADSKTGWLTSVEWISTQGKQPRFFCLRQDLLYAANELSDTIIEFRADRSGGKLHPTGKTVRNASPVTIAFSAS